MNYQDFFSDKLSELRNSGDYRVFADLEREAGAFPKAVFREGGQESPVNVWCSNDYLGQGQNPDVIAATASQTPTSPSTSFMATRATGGGTASARGGGRRGGSAPCRQRIRTTARTTSSVKLLYMRREDVEDVVRGFNVE